MYCTIISISFEINNFPLFKLIHLSATMLNQPLTTPPAVDPQSNPSLYSLLLSIILSPVNSQTLHPLATLLSCYPRTKPVPPPTSTRLPPPRLHPQSHHANNSFRDVSSTFDIRFLPSSSFDVASTIATSSCFATFAITTACCVGA